jgi:hypothetical protein
LEGAQPLCDHPPVAQWKLTAGTVAGVALLAAALSLEACRAGPSAPPRPAPPEPPPAAAAPRPTATPSPTPLKTVAAAQKPPVWRPGDRWTYSIFIGTEQGTKTVEVIEVRESSNPPFYVLRVGELEHLYTTQLQWAGHARDRKIESRISPPLPWFTWPLEPGRRWTYRGTLQDATGSLQREDTFVVLGAEIVDVPAGRFDTIKVLHEGDRGDRNEYWYAPDVRSYIKWVWQRGTSRTEELLREYHAAPRT